MRWRASIRPPSVIEETLLERLAGLISMSIDSAHELRSADFADGRRAWRSSCPAISNASNLRRLFHAFDGATPDAMSGPPTTPRGSNSGCAEAIAIARRGHHGISARFVSLALYYDIRA